MAREVRITIDDDEVFERMKARKRELDLSWEEVLHRGLREVPEERPGEPQPPGASPGREGDRRAADDRRGHHGHDVNVEFGSGSVDHGDSIGAMVEEIKGQVHDQVRESLRASMESVETAGAGLEREMTELERAEDAVLRFDDVTGDDPRYRVPLRVRLETSRGGLDFEVVAVRGGKSVAGMNRFDRETRQAINEHLARGGTATLSFDSEEAYEVGPAIAWRRDDDGAPVVSDVGIPEVLFDDE
ncbi:hypothetical protein ACFQMA_06370 [Halosimplex aquaticum]|uniref:Uncharacterized protein n=1 Tax=Halosimplex aquaticum TaxID=3026162 RepID=A0ABD5XWI6_9EURY|nr:hypothetical protein [Halosimplex aquaticum]